MLITAQNGTLISPLFFNCRNVHFSCQITLFFPVHFKETFRQFFTVNGGRKKTRWRKSGVVAETRKLPAKTFYGYQVMDGCWHSVTIHLTNKRRKRPLIVKFFWSYSMWTKYFIRMNWTTQRINTLNRPLLVHSIFITQSCKQWNSTKFFSIQF